MKVTLRKSKSSEKEFWKYYLALINASQYKLTDREISVMIEVLAGDPYKSMFKLKERKKLSQALNIKYSSYLVELKKSLINKGFLVETGEVAGDVLVAQPLRDFQLRIKKAIEEGQDLKLSLEFNGIQ